MGACHGWQTGPDQATAVGTLPGDTSVIPPIPESVVVAGSYQCAAEFDDPDADPIAQLDGFCPSGRDIFVARYSAAGDGIWAVDRPDGAGQESISNLTIDDDGRAWLSGEFAEGGTSTLLASDFESGFNGWSSSNSDFGVRRSTDSVSTVSAFFTQSVALALRGGTVNIDSPVINTANSQQVKISLQALRGFDPGDSVFEGQVSEYPENDDENLLIQWYGSDNQWHTLRTLPAGGTAGEQFDLIDADLRFCSFGLDRSESVPCRLHDSPAVRWGRRDVHPQFDWYYYTLF